MRMGWGILPAASHMRSVLTDVLSSAAAAGARSSRGCGTSLPWQGISVSSVSWGAIIFRFRVGAQYVSLLFTYSVCRRFVVAVSENCVWVEGLQVVGSHAGPRLEIFRLLWQSYLEDLLRGTPPEDFQSRSLQAIVQLLEPRLGKG